MGAGIAQVALEAGDEVLLHDVDPSAFERAHGRVREGLARRSSKAGLRGSAAEAWIDVRLERLHPAASLAAVAIGVDLVIEAALEDLALKQSIFRALDAVAAPDVILATNTSALSVASIAEVVSRPERVLGLHFFNPVPVLPLVEVVVTAWTEPALADRAEAHMAAWGRTTVRCADSPGFIVNRVNRPFTIEALRMLEAGDADVASIDASMRGAGYPMGPFELMDLIGLDVNLAAATAVWEGLGRPDRLRPSPIQERLVTEGRLGRKTGVGFYRYDSAERSVDEPFATSSLPPTDAGSIARRIETAVAAEAQLAAADGIATSDDIALALRVGAGHPRSPFRRCGALPAVGRPTRYDRPHDP
jgi:3-hydroxybutyryl-CoA dehydrogenase